MHACIRWARQAQSRELLSVQGALKPFRWRSSDQVAHRGQPEVFDFEFDLMVPRSPDAMTPEGGWQQAMDRSVAAAA